MQKFICIGLLILILINVPILAQGNTLDFDGTNDYIQLPGALSIKNSSFTIEGWYQLSDLTNNERTFFSVGNGTTDYFSIQLVPQGEDGAFNIIRNSEAIFGHAYNFDNQWHHLAYTFNTTGGAAILYLDGVQVKSSTMSAINETGTAIIGATTLIPVYCMKGSIDEIRIWNVVRTQTQISSNKSNTSLSPSSTGLLGYYHFDQGTIGANNSAISTLVDATSHGYNGTLTNFALTGSTSNWISSDAPLPVELVSFSATKLNATTLLSWSTATEVDNYGFEVERSTDANSWELVGFVSGAGNSNSTKEYSFTDAKPLSSKNYYRLKQIDTDGSFDYSSLVAADFGSPVSYSLNQNYPNPFNPSTIISFSLPVQENVTLKIFDVLGNEVVTLVDGLVDAGNHNIVLSAANLASGFYFYQLETPHFSTVKKMQLIK